VSEREGEGEGEKEGERERERERERGAARHLGALRVLAAVAAAVADAERRAPHLRAPREKRERSGLVSCRGSVFTAGAHHYRRKILQRKFGISDSTGNVDPLLHSPPELNLGCRRCAERRRSRARECTTSQPSTPPRPTAFYTHTHTHGSPERREGGRTAMCEHDSPRATAWLQRRPPPWPMQNEVAPAADLAQPSCVQRLPPPCALQKSVLPSAPFWQFCIFFPPSQAPPPSLSDDPPVACGVASSAHVNWEGPTGRVGATHALNRRL
jgi:hypothetical protein